MLAEIRQLPESAAYACVVYSSYGTGAAASRRESCSQILSARLPPALAALIRPLGQLFAPSGHHVPSNG